MQRLRRLSSSITDLFRQSLSSGKIEDEEEPQESIGKRYPLHNACVFGNTVEVEYLLSAGRCDASDEDDKGRIPLHYSVQHSDSYISKLLISYGANVDSVDYVESSPSHFVATVGQVENACLLLNHGADFCSRDKMGRTAVDVGAEEGHLGFTKLMVEQGCLDRLIQILEKESKVTTTPLHLAARNGHIEVVSLLIDSNFPLNFTTYQGSALHEAIKNDQIQVIRLLIHHGINMSLTDHNGTTAWKLANLLSRHNPVSSPLILELIQESRRRTYGIAICDFQHDWRNLKYREEKGPGLQLPLKAGDIVWILGYNETLKESPFLRGITFSSRGNSRCGFIPKRAVRILNRPLDKGEKSGSTMVYKKSAGPCKMKVKKVDIPIVPTTMEDYCETAFNSSNTTDYHTDSGSNASDRHSYYTNSSAPLPGISPTPSRAGSFYDGATVASFPDDDYPDSAGVSQQMSKSCSTVMQHANSYGALINNTFQESNRDTFGNVRNRSVLPDMPSSSSISSQFSGRSSFCLTDNYSGRVTATLSSSTSRSSNMLSSGYSNNPVSTPYRLAQPLPGGRVKHRVSEMLARGLSENAIIAEWLNGVGFPQYLQLFSLHGYDLASIARVTPQDLIALGITKPDHRRQMIQDIHNWNIADGYPSFVPSTNGISDFLTAIGLPQYIELFESQNCKTIKDLEELSWEDFEDIGIKKLGHMKRLDIALKKLKANREARQKCNSESQHLVSNYPSGTLTSRSSSALGEQLQTFENTNTLRKPTRTSLPETQNKEIRPRPVVPVMPSHHVPRHAPDSSDFIDAGQEPKKSTKLNLMMKSEILSKLDDLENNECVALNNDDLPPSPAPIMYHNALEWVNSVKLPGDIAVPPSAKELRHHRCSEINDLNDLGQMLKDLTDELDAKLHTSTTV